MQSLKMANHRPWQRVKSMFRRRRTSGSSHQPVSSRHDRLMAIHEPFINYTPPGRMMSRLFRNAYRSQQLEVSPRVSPLNSVVNWSSLIFTTSPFGQNLERFRDFTPKCLTDINCQEVLMGQDSYDNFSQSCWLEDHLHNFACVGEDIVYEVEDENQCGESISSLDENFTLVAVSSRLQMRGNPQGLGPGDTLRSSSSNSLSIHRSSGPGSRGSTISDVTQFYNNMIRTGLCTSAGQPPPYSEQSEDDPPPSYTEVFIPRPVMEGRRQSSASARASNSIFHDILW